MHVQFSGRYRLQVFHGDTDILLKDTGWFDNLITDNGLDLLGTGFPVNCYVGSDTAAPGESDTSILNVLASSSSSAATYGVNYTVDPYYGWTQITFTFSIGAVQGTIGQVAVGGSATTLFSKAQLKTTGGTTTTLTLGGVDRLSLTYELRQCIYTSDVTGVIDINGVSYSYTGRPANISSSGAWGCRAGQAVGSQAGSSYCYMHLGATSLGAVTGIPDGTSKSTVPAATSSYVSGSHRRDFAIGLATSEGNLTNINAFVIGVSSAASTNGGTWQFLLSSGVDKTQYQNFRLEFAYTWGRCA